MGTCVYITNSELEYWILEYHFQILEYFCYWKSKVEKKSLFLLKWIYKKLLWL